MCMSGSMYSNNDQRRIHADSRTKLVSQSFAEECVRLCSQSDRENGIFDLKKMKVNKIRGN